MSGRLSRLGWYRGVLGGNRAWAGLWVGLAVARGARRLATKQPQLLSVETLRQGQSVIITSLGPEPTRRQRRRARRRDNLP